MEALNMSLDDYMQKEKKEKSNSYSNNNRNQYRNSNNYNNRGPYQNRQKYVQPSNNNNDDWDHDMFENDGENKRSYQTNRNERRQITIDRTQKSIKVSNLHYSIIEADLKQLFLQFGELKSCNIQWDSIGRSTGVAYIEYEEESSAAKAIKEYNGAELDGQQLIIEYGTRQQDRQQESISNASKKISKPDNDFRNNSGNYQRRFNNNYGQRRNNRY